jgi:hypothetical protein
MFRKKTPTQEDLDYCLRWAAHDGKTRKVEKLLATGAKVHPTNDFGFHWAVWFRYTEIMKLLLEAGVDVHQNDDYALRHTRLTGNHERLQIVQEAIRKQNARREKERLELERQQNPLLAGTGLTFAEFRPENIDALLREATAEQEQIGRPTRAGVPDREYIPLPKP